MEEVDILGMGNSGTVTGKSGESYEGKIFDKKGERSISYQGKAFFIDIKELKEHNVISKNSTKFINEEEFDKNSLKGDYYMIIENQLKIGRGTSTYDDLMG